MAMSGRLSQDPSSRRWGASSFPSFTTPDRRSRRMHRMAAPAALAAAALLASPARAEDPMDVHLRWDAPAGCPGDAYVRAAVERLVGRPLEATGGLRVPVRVEAAPAEGGAWVV